VYLKGFPLLEDTLEKLTFTKYLLQKRGQKTITLGGTKDLIYSSMKALLYYDIDLEKYMKECKLPEKFEKVSIPKNIFVSKSFTDYPKFKYFEYRNIG